MGVKSKARARAPLILAAMLVLGAVAAPAAEIGPFKGALVIAGGGIKDPAILQRFIELAGGPEAAIVVIPTAGGAEYYAQNYSGARRIRDAGAKHVTVLHTADRKVADSESFVLPIREARGVWFGGGRQWRLADAYLHTRTHRELFALLERGGVIGGSSAGASVQGSYMARGDTKGNLAIMGDHEEGFGFLKNVAIDQHVLRRNRHFDMIGLIAAHPELLGIGLDENAAISVRGDRFEVIGQSYVLIYDNRSIIPPDGRFYFLAPGDRYDLAVRKATRPSRTMIPLEGIKAGKWPK